MKIFQQMYLWTRKYKYILKVMKIRKLKNQLRRTVSCSPSLQTPTSLAAVVCSGLKLFAAEDITVHPTINN